MAAGHYVEVGADHPRTNSATRAFYDHGWSGVTVEPVPQYAALHREQRSRDRQIEAVVTSAPGSTVPTARLDDLFAATGWGHGDIQFMLIDVERAADVLSTVDLSVWRPWVLVVEGTVSASTAGQDLRPESNGETWEPAVLAAGYEFCLFDGVSRFYVAEEHSELRPVLSYPACVLDDFARFQEEDLKAHHADQLAAANRELLYWRSVAIRSWGGAMAGRRSESVPLKNAISVLKAKVPRRLKAPLRKVRNAQRALARRARR